MARKKIEPKKLKCKECGNDTKFHSYGEVSADIIHKWNAKKKRYVSTPTSYYLYAQGQYSCVKCGADIDECVSDDPAWESDTWEGHF